MQNDKQIALSARDFYVLLALAFAYDMVEVKWPAEDEHSSPNELDSDDEDVTYEAKPWTYESLGALLDMSPSRIFESLEKLSVSGLYHGKGLKGRVDKGALLQFILHGARYVFPAIKGGIARGIPTASSSFLFNSKDLIQHTEKGPEYAFVWSSPKGNARGASITPLCHQVISSFFKNVSKNVLLNMALVHFDVLRVGESRERKVAEAFFREHLKWKS